MTIHVISKTIPERILKINMYYCLFQKSLIKLSESPKIIPEKMKMYFVKINTNRAEGRGALQYIPSNGYSFTVLGSLCLKTSLPLLQC